MESLRTQDWVDNLSTLELPVQGKDCTGRTKKIQKKLAALSCVWSAEVLLSREKAVVEADHRRKS